MKTFSITRIHLGRYRLEFLDGAGQVISGTDGGSALVMLMLSKWLFEPEHTQYLKDQKVNSDEIGSTMIEDIKKNPEKYIGQTRP